MSNGQTNVNAISVSGLLKNMLQDGFSTRHCISELIDDSLGASSRTIKIYLDSNKCLLIVADDGNGMTRENLKKAHHLHSRSCASNKHGRFGIGRKYALAHFTQLKGAVKTVSRSVDTKILSQLDIDFVKVLESEEYNPYSHGIEAEFCSIWDTYALNKDSNGTMTHLQCASSVLNEMIEMIKSENVAQSLNYFLGTTYHNFLKSGGEIIIVLDGVEKSIEPIDRLCWDSVKEKTEHIIAIYFNKTSREVRGYFDEQYTKAHKGKTGYLIFKKGKRPSFEKEEEPNGESWENLGQVTLRCAYSENWNPLQKAVLKKMGINVPEGNEEGIEELRRILGGTDIERNGKLVAQFQAEKAKAGDHAAYHYHENSRYSVKFNAVTDDKKPLDDEEFTLDNVFNIQVNKSRVDMSLIDQTVWATIEKIRKAYVGSCYTRLYHQTSEEETPPTNTNAIIPPAFRLVKKVENNNEQKEEETQVDECGVQNGEEGLEAEDEAPEEQLIEDTMVESSDKINLVIHETTSAVVEVAPHQREVSKTPRDLLIQVRRMLSSYTESQLDSAIANASNIVESGITAKYRLLLEIDEDIQKLI